MKKVFILLFFTALCSGISAQKSVRGKIVSADDGEALPGATIMVKGTTQGVTSDFDGNYRITVPSEQSVIQITFVGFVTEEIKVGNRTEINVQMKPKVNEFEEVVVIGYGEQRKASIVGAVSNIKSEELRRAAPSNLTANIGGRITGALVRLGDGNVGGADNRYTTGELDDATILIRGRATSNPASPLIIVDGVESSFSRINPEDVDQLSLLKDASATAVYGVRGANGVIVITTKQGSTGKPKIRVNAQVRAHQPLKYPRPLGSYQYALLHNEAQRNDGVPEANLKYSEEDLEHYRLGDDPIFHPDVDWYDEIVKDYFIEEQYNANVSGGTDKVKYYISGEYNHAGGPWKTKKEMENDYKRYNLRTNFDFNITKTTDLSVKLNGRMENRGDVFYGESTGQRYFGSFWYHISHISPNVAPIRWPNGSWAYGIDQNWNVRAILDDGGYRTRFTNALDASAHIKQKLDFILPGLSLQALYSTTYTSGYRLKWGEQNIAQLFDYRVDPITGQETYTQKYDKRPRGRNTDVAISSDQDNSVHYIRKTQTEFRLNYSKLFNENHRVDVLALVQQSISEDNWNLPFMYRGFSGRLNYAYKMKYLVDINAAYNGSDRFAKGERYAWFPAVGLGYVISEENFWKDRLNFISYLKIRGSYGAVGNDRLAEGLRYMYKYEFTGSPGRNQSYNNQELYNFGETPLGQGGMTEGTLANEKVTWEVAKKYNIGVDLRLWDNRIKVTADLFRENRDNILAVRGDVPAQAGMASGTVPASNIRVTTNSGYEFELAYSDNFGDFNITLSGNYSFARSKVIDWAEAYDIYEYRMAKGYPVSQPRAYLWSGKFYAQEDIDSPDVAKPAGGAVAGDLMFVDLSGDGVIDANDMTRQLGKNGVGYGTIPEIIYGFNTNFEYKGFYLDLFWQGVAHVNSRWINGMRYEFNGGGNGQYGNVYEFHLDRWVYDPVNGLDTRETATYPRLALNGAWGTQQDSSFQRLNSAFLRLKSVELGYNFPNSWAAKIGMSDLRVFVGGSNVWTFDKIGWVDPEYNPENSGQRGNSYPQTKFYSVGVNASF